MYSQKMFSFVAYDSTLDPNNKVGIRIRPDPDPRNCRKGGDKKVFHLLRKKSLHLTTVYCTVNNIIFVKVLSDIIFWSIESYLLIYLLPAFDYTVL
jgi:hypothetical protein